ncbi:hypothetical protein [Rhizobium sp. LC145]|uniref:hypothetical protein n=1 Tax=Rhizobium sp. LC145 TaxID=1120688 RepID=UPI00062A1218|nr:hypothetical protein [Rhizobium sp. LC145]KKX34341.1 membrane protein [Rhizobium sp. LC145]TKT65527.1 hypothetical protein FDR95_07450 [Rhizobiaceae bacterium LC148]
MRYSSKARLLLAGAALSILSGPAFALDGNDLLTKLNAALMQQGGLVTAQSVDVEGSTVTLAGAAFKPTSSAESLPLGDITLEGVQEANGGYHVEKASFPNINITQDKTTVTAADISMSGVSIPAETTGDTLDTILFYEEAHVGPMNVSVDGKSVFSVDETNFTATTTEDKSSMNFSGAMTGVKADLSTYPDPKAQEAITELGLTTLDGRVDLAGSWELASGKIDLTRYALDFNNIGKLDFLFSLSGYTLQFLKSVQETTAAMEANPNKEEAQQAANLAMLGLMQQLTFNSAEIRFEDAGITGRALDFTGKKQGVSGQQMAQIVKGMAPLMLAQLNVPELQNMVSAAINTYIDNPGNLTISARPEKPVPVPMIMGAAMGAPNTLPQVLGVTVTANE